MKRELAQHKSQQLTLLSSIDIPLFAAIAAMPTVLLAAYLPANLLLPAIVVLAFALAAFAAAIGWMTGTRRDGETVTIWDFAGACVLVGAAAAVFSETTQVSHLFGVAMANP